MGLNIKTEGRDSGHHGSSIQPLICLSVYLSVSVFHFSTCRHGLSHLWSVVKATIVTITSAFFLSNCFLWRSFHLCLLFVFVSVLANVLISPHKIMRQASWKSSDLWHKPCKYNVQLVLFYVFLLFTIYNQCKALIVCIECKALIVDCRPNYCPWKL